MNKPNNMVSHWAVKALGYMGILIYLNTGVAYAADADNDGLSDALECPNAVSDSLMNGGFEQPPITANTFQLIPKANVSGWDTTDTLDLIEIWATGYEGTPSYERNQFAELNAISAAALFQDLTTIPGETMRWRLAHRGREGTDVMRVEIGPTSGPLVEQAQLTDDNSAWGIHSGLYTIPSGQSVTRFAFTAVSTASSTESSGNFLDAIEFFRVDRDTDLDGISDCNDTDSDNDGIPDSVEVGADPNNPLDSDNDNLADYRDTDSDNDGLSDATEQDAGTSTTDASDNDTPEEQWATIVAASDTTADGQPSVSELSNAGVNNVIPGNMPAYEVGLHDPTALGLAAYVDVASPTLAELQGLIDAVNANQSALDEVLEDSASTGGDNNANNTAVTAAQLVAITDIININPDYEVHYQAAITTESNFSNPPTVVEIQTLINTVNLASGLDSDNDGLTYAQEVVLGTDPNNANSDSSQTTSINESTNDISDALEDLDGDGVSNIVELTNGSDPLNGDDPLSGGSVNGNNDDDGDGLTNGEEALLGTDSDVADSDSTLTAGTNEAGNALSDALEDFDGDGLSNIVELANGSNPLNGDDPLTGGAANGNDDPDDDGLNNGEEALLGTSPVIADSDSTQTGVNEANNSINDANEDFDGDGISNIDELNTGSNPLDANDLHRVQLQLKTILSGAYHSLTGLMFDRLRSKDLIPLSEPYTALGFANIQSGLLETSVLDTQGDDAAVDWILIELRSAIDPTRVITRHAVLLQRDGDVMDVTANQTLSLLGVVAGDYHVVIRHRNHLGVMTASPVSLSETVTSIDFSDPATQVFGTHARRTISSTVDALWAGDANGDGEVIGNGPGTDVNGIFSDVLVDTDNVTFSSNYIVKGYLQADLNLDGRVIFVGVDNVVNVVVGATLLHPANDSLNNNYVIQEQLP